MLAMSIKKANFYDLHKVHYVGTGGATIANILQNMRRGNLPENSLGSFSPTNHIGQSSAILFSPVINLLRFYSLLEIALIGKVIPEPDYMDGFWKEATENLSLLVPSQAADDNYPIVLPQFLLGRLEGRMHLEEEAIDVRYGEITSIFVSFSNLISRWRNPGTDMFLRLALSQDTGDNDLEMFRMVVGDKNEFMGRILVRRSDRSRFPDQLLHGLSETLDLCEDIDRLLGESEAFPLLQSAMWIYHADLFSAVDRRLPSYLLKVVESFGNWVQDEPQSERAAEINDYIENVKDFMNRLSSGAYGSALRPDVVQPLAPAMA
jgi:hypothetical protein